MKVRLASRSGWVIESYATLPAHIAARVAGGTAFIVEEDPNAPAQAPVIESAAVNPARTGFGVRIRKAAARLEQGLKNADRSIRNKRRGDTFCRLIG